MNATHSNASKCNERRLGAQVVVSACMLCGGRLKGGLIVAAFMLLLHGASGSSGVPSGSSSTTSTGPSTTSSGGPGSGTGSTGGGFKYVKTVQP